jgi:hypothetical protein
MIGEGPDALAAQVPMDISTTRDRDTTSPTSPAGAARASSAAMLDEWRVLIRGAAEVLRGDVREPGWEARLRAEVTALRGLTERDADLALYFLLFASGHGQRAYGVVHAVTCAVIVELAGRWLDWSPSQLTSAVCAALSMNISMAEQQDVLAQQAEPPTADQRDQIERHAAASADMLRVAGVDDGDWIHAVHHHHVGQQDDDSNAAHPADKLAELIRRIDVYTAKLSRRASRAPISPAIAARAALLGPKGHPDHVGATLLRVLGLYPPGTWVSLANGELAIVVRRGAKAHTPVVASVRTSDGGHFTQPTRRETTGSEFRILHGIRAGDVRVDLDHPRALTA